MAVNRRRFLETLGAGAASTALPSLLSQASADSVQLDRPPRRLPPGGRERPPYSPSREKSVLQESDLRYIGAFRMPSAIGAGDPPWGNGLAHRYVGGQLRFFSKAHGNPPPARIYEVAAPNLAEDPAAAPTAQLVRVWGDIVGPDSHGHTWGLFWDEQDRRLYWANGNSYNTTSPFDPSIGYCTLNDSTGTFTRAGVWGFNGRSCKMAMGGLAAIPQWFSDAYCTGQRLGAGFGGYFSIAATGPVSMGPALAAFDPQELASTPSRESVPNTPLVGYPFNATPYTQPHRAHRDTDYRTEFDGWNPRDGVGHWSWTDYIWQGGVWVDTPEKTGLLFFPTLGNGRTWYENSTLNAERSSHWWYVYDPADLAGVALGQRRQWEIQARYTWQVQYAGIDHPLGGWHDEPTRHVVGATFDALSRTLSVAVRFALGFRTGSPIVVYVYEVA